MGQGKRRNKPITASSVVSFARITAVCRTCGQKFEIDPVRAVTGVANRQETTTYCSRRCNHLAPAVVSASKGSCQACGVSGPTVKLHSGIALCVPDAWVAFGACLRKPKFDTAGQAQAAIPAARPADVALLQVYPCGLCDGMHLTKGQADARPEVLPVVRGAYTRLGLHPDSDRTART